MELQLLVEIRTIITDGLIAALKGKVILNCVKLREVEVGATEGMGYNLQIFVQTVLL